MPGRVLLTGAAGFLGSHALRHFLRNTDWDPIICPVSLDHKGRMDRIRHACGGLAGAEDRVRIVACDLARSLPGYVRGIIGEPDYIVNYASASHVDRSIADPVSFTLNNVRLMLTLLELARDIPGLRGFWHVSTDEVFGPSDGGLAREDDPHRPSNPYAASKSCQSQMGFAWWRTYGVPFAEVYCCNALGEHQDGEKFVPMAIRKIASGEPVPVHADRSGQPGSRYWQHARNIADAVLYLARNVPPARYGDPRDPVGARVPFRFNVTSGDRIDNLGVVDLIGTAMGRPCWAKIRDGETDRPGHDLHYGIDGTRLRDLGWVPPVSFGEAVKRTVARGMLSSPD